MSCGSTSSYNENINFENGPSKISSCSQHSQWPGADDTSPYRYRNIYLLLYVIFKNGRGATVRKGPWLGNQLSRRE